MKEVIKSAGVGIGIAAAMFCIAGVVFDILYGGNFSLSDYGFTKMAVGCFIVGMGFGIPSVVYKKDSIPRPLQILIHMGIGCIVYTSVAFAVGWIPTEMGVAKCLMALLGGIGVAFVIWLICLKYYKDEAKRMNEKIGEIDAETQSDDCICNHNGL